MSEPRTKQSADGNGVKAVIFVVDDEAMLLELATIILQPLGYDVRTFRNPEAAVHAFTEASPRPVLVITDFAMHKLNGLALIQACRKVEPRQKILMVSGTVGPEILEGEPVQPDRFLLKPYNSKQLIDLVSSMLED